MLLRPGQRERVSLRLLHRAICALARPNEALPRRHKRALQKRRTTHPTESRRRPLRCVTSRTERGHDSLPMPKEQRHFADPQPIAVL